MSWQNLALQIKPSPRSVAACQSAAGSLLYLHSALLRGRTASGDPAALQVKVVRSSSLVVGYQAWRGNGSYEYSDKWISGWD